MFIIKILLHCHRFYSWCVRCQCTRMSRQGSDGTALYPTAPNASDTLTIGAVPIDYSWVYRWDVSACSLLVLMRKVRGMA